MNDDKRSKINKNPFFSLKKCEFSEILPIFQNTNYKTELNRNCLHQSMVQGAISQKKHSAENKSKTSEYKFERRKKKTETKNMLYLIINLHVNMEWHHISFLSYRFHRENEQKKKKLKKFISFCYCCYHPCGVFYFSFFFSFTVVVLRIIFLFEFLFLFRFHFMRFAPILFYSFIYEKGFVTKTNLKMIELNTGRREFERKWKKKKKKMKMKKRNERQRKRENAVR